MELPGMHRPIFGKADNGEYYGFLFLIGIVVWQGGDLPYQPVEDPNL